MNTRLLLLACCFLSGFVVGCPGPNDVPDTGVDGGLMPPDSGPLRDTGPLRDSGPRDTGTDTGRDGGMDAFVEPDAFIGPDAFVPPDAFVDSCGGCSDGNPCNGEEICDEATMTCGPAADPLSCDDSMACTTDACDPVTGCTHTGIDGDADGDPDCTDCGPANPLVHAGATELCNGIDDNCNGTPDEGVASTVYADCDGDGWADSSALSNTGCPPPPASDTGCGTAAQAWTPRAPTETDFDCADADARAHATATAFQTTPLAGAAPETDFDFNCDFEETQQFAVTGSCVVGAGGCVTTPGWLLPVVPECGASATFIAGCTAACVASTEARVQGCR